MFSSSPLESTAGSAYLNFKSDERASIRSMFSSQLIAAIRENTGVEDIVTSFNDATYAALSPAQSPISSILSSSLAEILDNGPGGPLAVINSPIQLTPAGEAVNLSGFSPSSARRLFGYLDELQVESAQIRLLSDLLSRFGNLDEQQNYHWRKISDNQNTRYPLKQADMGMVLHGILQRQGFRQIFELLPARKRSKAGLDTVDKQFDTFVSLIENVIHMYLPWLLRGLASLSLFGNEAGRNIPWANMAAEIENAFISQHGAGELVDDDTIEE